MRVVPVSPGVSWSDVFRFGELESSAAARSVVCAGGINVFLRGGLNIFLSSTGVTIVSSKVPNVSNSAKSTSNSCSVDKR